MTRQQTCDVWFDIFEPVVDKWVPTKFKAKCFEVETDGGTQLYKLFTPGILGRVLGRTGRTIRGWESQGKIPPPRFRFDRDEDHLIGKGESRFYSEEQIRMMSAHQRGIHGEDPRTSKGPALNSEAFFQAVREDWNIDDFDENDYTYEFEDVIKGAKNVHIQ